MISISSRPSAPDSPACGFNPATAIRGLARSAQPAMRENLRSEQVRPGQSPPCFSARGTSRSGKWVVTSATVSFPPVRSMAKFFTPQRVGKKFGLAGKLEADLVHARLVDRAGHDRVDFAAAGERDASSKAPRAARAVSAVGWPNDNRHVLPMTSIFGGFGQLPGSRARPERSPVRCRRDRRV